jgi:integrase
VTVVVAGEQFGVHGLRHSVATRLLEDKQSLRDVADRLGHTDETITSKVYGHMFDDQRQIQRGVMSRILHGDGQ